MNKNWLILLLTMFMVACASKPKPQEVNAALTDPQFIGVLESTGDKQEPRVLFKREGSQWIAFDQPADQKQLIERAKSYPSAVKWDVWIRGTKIHSFLATTEYWSLYSEVGKQKISEPLPTSLKIKNSNSKFENWMEVPKFRPLLLTANVRVSTPIFSEELVELNEQQKKFLITKFRSKYPSALLCTVIGGDQIKSKAGSYKDTDLEFIHQQRLTSDLILVALELKEAIGQCDGPPEDEWLRQWFLLSGQEVKYLGESIYPVDKFITSDGEEFWLFSGAGYNQDGYTLYFDNFSNSAVTSWKYH